MREAVEFEHKNEVESLGVTIEELRNLLKNMEELKDKWRKIAEGSA